jgi:hypothetical protein
MARRAQGKLSAANQAQKPVLAGVRFSVPVKSVGIAFWALNTGGHARFLLVPTSSHKFRICVLRMLLQIILKVSPGAIGRKYDFQALFDNTQVLGIGG